MSGADPFVAAIVLNWNDKVASARCLESLLNSDEPELRVYCVDNGSEDGSLDELPARFPHVTFVATGANLYYAGGNNAGMRRALADGATYIVIINNDTVVAPDMVSRLRRALEETPQAGLVGPKIFYLDHPEVLWSAGGGINWWLGLTWHYGLRKPDGPAYSRRRSVGYLTGCAIMARRCVVEEIGLLDAEYVLYAEDADWCVRARRAGWDLLYVPEATMWHEVSRSSGGAQSPFKVYHKVRSNFRLFRQYARPYHWVTIPFAVLFGAVVYGIRALLSGNTAALRALLRAGGDALSGRARRA